LGLSEINSGAAQEAVSGFISRQLDCSKLSRGSTLPLNLALEKKYSANELIPYLKTIISVFFLLSRGAISDECKNDKRNSPFSSGLCHRNIGSSRIF
jgi:hypothetical protein